MKFNHNESNFDISNPPTDFLTRSSPSCPEQRKILQTIWLVDTFSGCRRWFFFLMKEQEKKLRKTNVKFRKCYSKIDIKRLETCSWHLQNKTRKWNEETFYVFFRHSSFIFKKVIIVCFILNSNRREMKSDEVHSLLSPIQSFIK